MADETKTTAPIGESFQIKAGEPLKNMLNRQTLYAGAMVIQSVYAPFKADEFVSSVMDEAWDGLELKARGRQVTLNMAKYLPPGYPDALAILEKVTRDYGGGFFVLGMSFPDFVEVYGLDDAYWDLSVNALAKFTVYWSSELAVRPFIIKNEERMMAQMLEWAGHENEHIRRLASEGCRPALPWAVSLPKFKKDPAPILPILARLKTDPSAYVRKSAANNLNDISKTRPDVVVRIAKEWYGEHEYTNWIIKHGCRTLLKKGDREILALFGLGDNTNVTAGDFKLDAASVPIGGELGFSFTLHAVKAAKVRLEYAVDYVKSGGKHSRKIFQISEVTLKENEKKPYVRKHSFADLSTRKHYPGTHRVTLIVNGEECGTLEFEVLEDIVSRL